MVARAKTKRKALAQLDLADLKSAPELYRTRARFAAGLAATASGAVATGVLFSTEILPDSAQAFALVALLLLLLSTALFTSASLYWRDKIPGGDSEYKQELISLIIVVSRCVRGGAAFGLLALVALWTAALVGVTQPLGVDIVRIEMTDEALGAAREVCPDLKSPFDAETVEGAFEGAGRLITVDIEDGVCGAGARSSTLHLPTSGIAAAVELR